MLNWKYLFTSIAIVGFSFLGYLTYTDNLPQLLNGRLFLSQVTPIEDSDLTYLQSLNGLAPLDVNSIQELEQKLIETLLSHVNEFDSTSAPEAEEYLKTYYAMTDPIPSSVLNAVSAAAVKFLQAQILVNANTSTFSPFINEVLSVLANHEVSTNNHQAVKRSQTSRALLDSLLKQL